MGKIIEIGFRLFLYFGVFVIIFIVLDPDIEIWQRAVVLTLLYLYMDTIN